MQRPELHPIEQILYAARSHIGASPQRTLLEDRCRADRIHTAGGKVMTLAVVADGIGGENAGERAAEITVETVFEHCQRAVEGDIPEILAKALQEANQRVYSEARRSRRKMNMGSTAAVAAIVDQKLFVANVGDSRIYLLRDGEARQLTIDHTWAWDVTRSGKLTPQEVANHPRREEIVRSIGYEASLDVDLGLWLEGGQEGDAQARRAQGLILHPGDRILLCSDGVTKTRHDSPTTHYVETQELIPLVRGRAPARAVAEILRTARNRKVDDNVSAVILEVAGEKHRVGRALPLGKLGGALLLLFALLAGAWLVTSGLPEKDSSQGVDSSASLPAGVAFISGLNGMAEKQISGGLFRAVQLEEIVPAGQGVRLHTLGGEAWLRLDLADGSVVVLGPEAQIEIRAIAAGSGAEETVLVLERGAALVQRGAHAQADVIVASPYGVTAQALASLMGVIVDPIAMRMELDCFHGPCMLEGLAQEQLTSGEASWMNAKGATGAFGAARPENFAFGEDLLPVSTARPSATKPVQTLRATNTVGPLFEPPTATFTREPTKTSRPPTKTYTPLPTDTPEPTETDIIWWPTIIPSESFDAQATETPRPTRAMGG